MEPAAGRDGHRDAPGGQIACTHCGNRCRVPASRSRAYACPRCGAHLPHPPPAGDLSAPARRHRAGRGAAPTAWIVTVLLAALVIAVRAGVSSYRAAASGTEAVGAHPAPVRLTAAEARNYTFRLRQLEQDLRRDDQDYEVLLRLGELNLQLAEGEAEGKGSHLRRARHYLLQAGMHMLSRADAFQIHTLLDAANSPNPTFILASMPGQVGPPPREDEEWVRLRVGWLEDQVRFNPRSSRLLRRLADSYLALYSVMDHSGAGRLEHWQGGSSVSRPGEALGLAEQYYHRAIARARTHEALCRALYGEAELCRVANDPGRAAGLLQELLAIQPNNWLVSLEMASLCRQLGETARAKRYQAMAARWRTPGWI